jgi:cell division septation protein DedD
MMCENCLLVAYGRKKRTIDSGIVLETAKNLDWSLPDDERKDIQCPPSVTHPPAQTVAKSSRHRILRTALVLCVGILLSVGVFLLGDALLFTEPHKTAPQTVWGKVVRGPAVAQNREGVHSYAGDEPPEERDVPTMGAGSTDPPDPSSDEQRETVAGTPIETDSPTAGHIVIQVGAFREKLNAEHLATRLRQEGHDPYLESETVKDIGLVHRVRLTAGPDIQDARRTLARLHALGLKGYFVPITEHD